MTMKSWVLHRVAGRGDLPPRERGHEPDLDADAIPRDHGGAASDALRPGADLGVYAPLITAVRDELERFVVSHVRLHVTIADRDRFLLTSIGVRSPGGSQARELLQQFMHEFKPEQVKRYLAREVIGRLPNAGVIDLTLFGGLSDLEAGERAGDDGEYRELLAALRTTPAIARPYEVSVLGRWSEADAPTSPFANGRSAAPATPLAGRVVAFDVTDADGTRVATLSSVVPGRRYVIGKDESSDLRVDGTYTSRRHAEIWLDADGWRIADAGSTNGIRVVDDRSGRAARASAAAGDDAPIRVGDGMRIVLSARADGPPSDYPSIVPRAMSATAPSPSPVTPIATAAAAAPKTPLTAVLAARPSSAGFAIAITQGSGMQELSLDPDALPFTIGRSRGQTLVIDRRHAGVSGHHVAIDAIENDGVRGSVAGDNGVVVDGVPYDAGARFVWRRGETMVLGGSLPGESPCSLTLERPLQE
jgi:pSer/pThr/pTyr-binding forkhead associated (FHA) protein